MSSVDATEGGIVERIPPNAKPSDVIFGSPSKVDDLVIKLRAYAGAFKDGKAKLSDLALMDWTGAAAESFETAIKKLPLELDSAHTYFHAAANALDSYADKLRSVQKRCKPLIEDADAARAKSKAHWKAVDKYNAAVDRKDETLPPRPPDSDPGVAAMDSCHRRLDRLEAELEGVVTAAQKKLKKAAEKAPDKPPKKKGWDAWKEKGGDFLGGMKDGGKSIYKEFEYLVEDGFDGAALRLAGMADGAMYAAENPKEFAKAVTNWEEWQRNPARAAGQLTPDLLLALASGGVGGASKAATSAATRLARREAGLRRDGSARDRTNQNPDGNNTPDGEKKKEGEPVDVATGEMIMAATDVELPGALPLVLRRHYVSGHPCGGWFGATWAATLDQRLEIDDAGVVYVTEDGMLLTYPVPEPELPTLPTSGPRWPLSWDGKPDGTFTVTIPEQNRTLHFAPLPVGGPDLALKTITDRSGEGDRIDFAYDSRGAPTEITHSGGYRIAVDTDPALLRVTALRMLYGGGVAGREHSTTLLSFGYDPAGDLTEIINSTGKAMRYRYDDQHRITSWTDRNGTTYAYVYDHRGRVLRGIGPDGILSGRFHYDAEARTTRYTNSLGHTTTYECNAAYKVIAETDALGHTTRTEWDADNRHPVAVTDPLGHTTRYTYDDEGRPLSVEHPDGTVTETVYDDWGLPLQIREPGGGVWRHTYDDRGARTSVTDPAGAVTRYTYDILGHLASVTDPLGDTTTVTSDGAGLPAEVTDSAGQTTRIRRGPHGRITAVTDPLGRTTRYGWTIEGKPAWREYPDGTRETWQWDCEGNLVTHTSRSGHTTRHTSTHFDHPATRTDPDGAHYAFTYDTERRLIGVTNAQQGQWSYEYDPAGRLVAETDFNGATRSYGRDAAGRLTTSTNALGQTLSYTRDAAGRTVAQHDGSTGETSTYAYDPLGALIHATNAAAEVALERDLLGRVLTETVNGRTASYTYDAAGRRTSRTTPSGLTSTWTYDAAGQPAALSSEAGTLTFAYDAAGRETQRATGAVTLTQGWDVTDRLIHQTLTSSGTSREVLQHRDYAYSRDDGHVTEIRELTTGTRHFSLDAVGRVTGVEAHGWSETYAYDSAGNQTHATAPAHEAAGERAYTGTLIRSAGRTTYEHDAAGRLTGRTRRLLDGRTSTWTYTWNAQDRLTSATNPHGETWTYAYDPFGARLSTTGPDGRSRTFTWDTARLAEQTSDSGETTTWDYTPGTHTPLTQTDRAALTGELRFHAIVTDPAGTPAELVTPDGGIAWQHRTTLWGTPLPAPRDGVTCPLRFPGQYADPETGLHYNYFRYYDPETARYLTPDPIGLEGGFAPHSYVPNPYTWVDPLGLALLDVGKNGVRIVVHEYDVDKPAHAHVTGGGGREVRIGPNGHPLDGQPELSRGQRQAVEHYSTEIRSAVRKLGKRNQAEERAEQAEKERREAAKGCNK